MVVAGLVRDRLVVDRLVVVSAGLGAVVHGLVVDRVVVDRVVHGVVVVRGAGHGVPAGAGAVELQDPERLTARQQTRDLGVEFGVIEHFLTAFLNVWNGNAD
ncbi:hypothetical protein RM863_22400 [Streptomyces sp. DSM 41014]|uniref:Uncharacterized protein n=1 Tax=Streptomyces hintoniae TaxID=3075521 RepID=A0ABU2UNL6_9ACTN|nr:hypothetical protein [Streptomyces sp. DSM 41014]MDT0474877.1 hypothetical protein [Streptomyces sp. DSM 41014]